jgi:phage terminase large subunit-like protein
MSRRTASIRCSPLRPTVSTAFNIHGVVFDELHTQPNRKLFDVMTKGSGDARMQPLYFLITTAGNDTNTICYEVHQKAQDILDGRKVDPTFYPVIYGADLTRTGQIRRSGRRQIPRSVSRSASTRWKLPASRQSKIPARRTPSGSSA